MLYHWWNVYFFGSTQLCQGRGVLSLLHVQFQLLQDLFRFRCTRNLCFFHYPGYTSHIVREVQHLCFRSMQGLGIWWWSLTSINIIGESQSPRHPKELCWCIYGVVIRSSCEGTWGEDGGWGLNPRCPWAESFEAVCMQTQHPANSCRCCWKFF